MPSPDDNEKLLVWDKQHRDLEPHARRRQLAQLCGHLAKILKNLPAKGPTWAILTRDHKHNQPIQAKLVRYNPLRCRKLLKDIAYPDEQVFSIYAFSYHGIRIGVRITIDAGPNQGLQYLFAPNEFTDDINAKLQFMRSMDHSSANQGD